MVSFQNTVHDMPDSVLDCAETIPSQTIGDLRTLSGAMGDVSDPRRRERLSVRIEPPMVAKTGQPRIVRFSEKRLLERGMDDFV